MTKKDKSKNRPARPWRDNLEAITVSVIIIVLFKYFTLEAYKIPTGSMQPTLMGWENPQGGGVFDRVLVDKLSPHFRDFDRFEIVVFKYPLDTSKSFIKRILGLPGERLEIREGDVWVSESGEGPLHVLRRPRRIQDAQLKELETEGEWKLDRDWTADGDTVVGKGPGKARFPRTKQGVRDVFSDGYPAKMRDLVRGTGKGSGRKVVGDLRVTCDVQADAACEIVRITFQEGQRNYVLELPGPSAPPDAKPKAIVSDNEGTGGALPMTSAFDLRLEAGESYSILAQNLDDEVRLEVDGEVVHRFDVTPIAQASTNSRSGVELATSGGGAVFEDVEVSRDIYYTGGAQRWTSWNIPDDSYVMLGDNTQDSSDGRDWTLVGYRIDSGPDAGKEIWGNRRGNENPRHAAAEDGLGARIFFRDQLGELHVLRSREVTELNPRRESFVHRSLIRGRAVVVVWPPGPPLSLVSRFQWVR